MRLLNIETFEVEEFYDPPKYAILSHTWDRDREMTLQAWQSSSRRRREAYRKATCAAQQATRDGLDYIWIDTICIDKTSSAELSEAINSMFSWYEAAEVCYAYLSDVVFEGATDCEGLIRRSRWFTRGWTLQELIAPSKLIFYSSNWKRIGTRDRMGLLLSQITGIKSHYLMPERHVHPMTGMRTRARVSLARTPFHNATIAERLSWVSNRVTTRPEDIAYCLLGLFRINMPLLYGERGNAWIRLQKELITVSDDESIFAWVSVPQLEVLMNDGRDETGLDKGPTTRLDHLVRTRWKYAGGSTMLAPDPVNFYGFEDQLCLSSTRKLPYSMTNAGLFMKLPLIQVGFNGGFRAVYLAVLRCSPIIDGRSTATCDAVVLKRCSVDVLDEYQRDRCRFLGSRIQVNKAHVDFDSVTEVYIEDSNTIAGRIYEPVIKPNKSFYGFWIAFPRGRHPYEVQDLWHPRWQKIGEEYIRSWREMGIFGFSIDPSLNTYRGTLLFYKDGVQTYILDLGIVLNSDGTVIWTYETTVCETNHRTHGSIEGQPTRRLIAAEELNGKRQNDDSQGQMNVSFGELNFSSWLNEWNVRMTYITFDGDSQVVTKNNDAVLEA